PAFDRWLSLFSAPEPAQRIGQDRAAMLAVMAAVAVLKFVIVLGKLQSERHLLIGEWPVAVLVIQIGGAGLEEEPDRLWALLGFAHKCRIDIAAADIGEAADMAQHLAEQVGPLPSDRESADAAGADAADSPAGSILAQFVLLADLRQDFLFQEPRVLI